MNAPFARRAIFSAAMLALGGGCYSTAEGPEPAATALYFPVGILPSPGGKALYVVNSDFDLQFNGGTIEAYNLHDIRDIALGPFWSPETAGDTSDPCYGLGPNPNAILYPGPCGPLDLSHPPPRAVPYEGPLFKRGAKIGAFATDIVMACRPSTSLRLGGTVDCSRGGSANGAGARLFVPVRGDRSLTFFDVDDDRDGEQSFRLDCGQAGNGNCSDAFRSGIDASENTRALTLPAEPFGVSVSDRGDSIVVTHQASGSGALSSFAPSGGSQSNVLETKPVLQFVLGVPGSATGVAALPTPGIDALLGFDTTDYQPGFAVAYRLVAQVDVIRYFDDRFGAPERPFIQRTAAFGLSPTPSGIDSRDVTIDNSPSSARAVCEESCRTPLLNQCVADCALRSSEERTACEDACVTDDARQCMTACTRIPLPVYVSNRAPASLIIGEIRRSNTTGSSEVFSFYDSVALPTGPSRVVIGRIHDRRDPPGQYRQRVFVVCFDARNVIVYDPVARRVDGVIRTGRGPHAFVMDPVQPLAYIGHFTDSYIGLVDLDQAHTSTFQTIVATIGTPVAPQGTK